MQRYVGEPRFVALLLNETTYDTACHGYCGPAQTDVFLVPRSVFFDTRLYADLAGGNLVTPLDKLSFRQNATSAAWNADDLQEILTGNVSLSDFLTIVDDLTVNAAGGTIGRSIVFSINDEVAGNPLFYSLPHGVVRLAPYGPWLTAPT